MRVFVWPATSSASRIATVHHVARRDDIRPGFGVRQRLFDERFYGDVVQYVTRFIDDAVLAMGREWIERDVGDDAQLWKRFLDCLDRPLREAVSIPGLLAVETFRFGRRDGKQRERRDVQLDEAFGFAHELVDRDALDAGHARDSAVSSPR
jgi:hypothetical protein